MMGIRLHEIAAGRCGQLYDHRVEDQHSRHHAVGEAIAVTARLEYNGRATQAWDAEVTIETPGKKVALFRCTQLLLYPKVP